MHAWTSSSADVAETMSGARIVDQVTKLDAGSVTITIPFCRRSTRRISAPPWIFWAPDLSSTATKLARSGFSEQAYKLAGQPKGLVIVPGAGHVDFYDRVGLIPFDRLTAFFREYLKP